jgi:glycerol kinase
VIEAMNGLQPVAPRLSIDGGLANNGYFRGFLAQALGRQLTVPASMELTGHGCALFALIGAGTATIDDLPRQAPPQASIEPRSPLDPALRRKFADAVERSRNWR